MRSKPMNLRIKKNNLRILLFVFFSLLFILLYSLYSRFVLEDERLDYHSKMSRINTIQENSIEVDILNFSEDNCEIKYCKFGNCENEWSLPCDKLQDNDFVEEGEYEVSLSFEAYPLFPLSSKQRFKSWSIKNIVKSPGEKEGSIATENYLNAVKALLGDNYIWEIASVPMIMHINSIDQFYKQEDFKLPNGYFKSLFLLRELEEKYNEKEFGRFLEREITYLNSNVETISQQENSFPDPYILKLLGLGLDESYISLVERNVPETDDEEINFVFEKGPLATEEVYSVEYENFILYSEMSNILEDFDRKELSNYYLNQRASIYNNSSFDIYGLCSLAKFEDNSEIVDNIIPVLEEVLTDKEKYLIELNTIELLNCNYVSGKYNKEITGLDNAIRDSLIHRTVNIDNNSFIIRAITLCTPFNDCDDFFYVFELIDNLEFLLLYE